MNDCLRLKADINFEFMVKLMKNEIIILSAIILSACVSTTETRLPDGGIGYNIDCSGIGQSWAECQVQANEICPDSKYTVISSNEEESDNTDRFMLIKCDSES